MKKPTQSNYPKSFLSCIHADLDQESIVITFFRYLNYCVGAGNICIYMKRDYDWHIEMFSCLKEDSDCQITIYEDLGCQVASELEEIGGTLWFQDTEHFSTICDRYIYGVEGEIITSIATTRTGPSILIIMYRDNPPYSHFEDTLKQIGLLTQHYADHIEKCNRIMNRMTRDIWLDGPNIDGFPIC